MKTGLILFAHGSRDPRWAEPFEAILEAIRARSPALPVRLAFLELMSPDLAAAADALVESLEDDISRRSGMPHREVAPSAFTILRSYPWRGNIRELRNVLEQVTMLTDDLRLEARHFMQVLPRGETLVAQGPAPADADDAPAEALAAPVRPLAQAVAELERESILAALRATGGNKVATAKLLRISRAALYEKLALYGL